MLPQVRLVLFARSVLCCGIQDWRKALPRTVPVFTSFTQWAQVCSIEDRIPQVPWTHFETCPAQILAQAKVGLSGQAPFVFFFQSHLCFSCLVALVSATAMLDLALPRLLFVGPLGPLPLLWWPPPLGRPFSAVSFSDGCSALPVAFLCCFLRAVASSSLLPCQSLVVVAGPPLVMALPRCLLSPARSGIRFRCGWPVLPYCADVCRWPSSLIFKQCKFKF